MKGHRRPGTDGEAVPSRLRGTGQRQLPQPEARHRGNHLLELFPAVVVGFRRHRRLARRIFQPLPQPVRRPAHLLRLVDHQHRLLRQAGQRTGARTHQGRQKFPSRKGFARRRRMFQTGLPGDVGQQAAVPEPFDERQHPALIGLLHRPLAGDVEPPHRLDRVAEELEPDRPARPHREHVHDSAPDRVFPHHLDRLPPLVAGGLQVLDQQLRRKFLPGFERQGELAVELRVLDPQQGRAHRCHRDGRFASRQAPQSSHALLTDLGVRGKILPGKHVQGRDQLGTGRRGLRHQKVEECPDQLGQFLGLPAAVHYHQQRPLQRLPQQHQVNRLGRVGETGEGNGCGSSARLRPPQPLE